MLRLPVDSIIPQIGEHLRSHRCLVVQAPPGSGKTTRIPPALLDMVEGEVWVLEPRRLATRLAARRVAFERGERTGDTVGYQVRFEEVAGPRTRLRFMTEGVLTRRMLSNPELDGVGAVVLDEFHERHLEGDLALALLRRLQRKARPDLLLVVMSATLDVAPLIAYLGGCPLVGAEGRLFDITIHYTPYSADPLEQQVAAALGQLRREGLDGDGLVFLPGAAEIRRAARACQPIATRAGLLLLPLHGDLSPEEQDRAVLPADQPKLILSTNIAESSVTIEGVRAVIDSGLARLARDSPWSGLPSLEVARISKAAATQRAGRAGRTGPGRVVRLYSAEDFARRPDHELPEIGRRELTHTILELAALGVGSLDWFQPPPQASLDAATELLHRLGALDSEGRLTSTGLRMSQLPLHPRLARLVLEAGRRGVQEQGCRIAAVLSAGERLDPASAAGQSGPSDLLVLVERQWQSGTERVFKQIRAHAARAFRRDERDRTDGIKEGAVERVGAAQAARDSRATETAMLIAVLCAFPDRVARHRAGAVGRTAAPGAPAGGGAELLLASGGSALLSASSVVTSELLVAVDAEERSDRPLPLVRLASAVQAEWLVDLFPERVTEKRGVEWNRAAARVEAVSRLLYDDLVIEESRSGAPEPEAAARLLAEKAWETGLDRFADTGELAGFQARVAFAAQHSALPVPSETDIRAALESLANGLRSLSDLQAASRNGGLVREMLNLLDRRNPGGRRLLERLAPERVRLPCGRQVRVQYAPGQPPWIASRLQDFFGMKETPRVAAGKVPLVVHLLAPNQRPVQITQDLAGFWERHYPAVRRELSRRYPRHKWPEEPVKNEE